MPRLFRALARTLARTLAFALAALIHLAAGPADADNPKVFIDEAGVAIQGYDPVAYFTEGAPLEGDPAIAHEWNGATWHFASAEHRDAFAAEPERYAPRYGGYCAYAVAKGTARQADPQVWSIVEGRLYLNLGPAVQRMWQEDLQGNIALADRNWPAALVDPGRRDSAPETAGDR